MNKNSIKKGNYKYCFKMAIGYYYAGNVLDAKAFSFDVDGIDLVSASAFSSNFGFACEIFLKTLLLLKYDEYPKGHSLKDLFNKLDGETKTLIKTYYDSYSIEYFDFNQTLDIHDNIFNDSRYAY